MPTTQVTCPNCGARIAANIEQLIDVALDPSAKSRLLSGRLNVAQCGNCGFVAPLATPIAYHDADKELLIIHVPMELNLPKNEMERVIGTFTTAVQNSLPPEKRKGYLFTPKQALTRQSLIDIILEGDGVTKEMIEAQRDKMKLVEQFLSTPPENIEELVRAHDDQLDAEFFALMLAAAEQTLAAGREDVAQAVVAIRDQLVQLSSWGQQAMANQAKQQGLIQEVADRLNSLGAGITRESLLDLIIELAGEDDEKLQVAVGLARGAMDYQFFQTLTSRIESESDADTKEHLQTVRQRLTELTAVLDQQNEAVLKRAADTLRGLLASDNLDAAIESRLELFDDTFLAVLQANIQAAEQQRDIATAARLKQVFEKIVGALQTSAPPAIQFINRLMTYQTFEEAQEVIQQEAANYGPELLQWIDVLIEDLSAQGGNQAVDRLERLRAEAEQVLANAPAGAADATPADLTDAPPPPNLRLLTKDEPQPPPPGGGKIIELPSFRKGPRRER
jgi:predicted RNA-binding Zn-ribbon protein involved in translation (DUF1610 family)